MQLLKQKHDKKKSKQYIDQNPIEAITNIGSDIKQSFVDDLGKGVVTDLWDQFLGAGESRANGSGDMEMIAGEEIDLESMRKKDKKAEAQPGIDYAREIIQAGKHAGVENTREMEVKIQEILIEIKQLANSSTELREKVEIISVEQIAEAPGAYHINFFEQILQWLRDARMNVEDSLAWFHALRSKKAAKQYGKLTKKHGTSFSLSNERTVSTQTG